MRAKNHREIIIANIKYTCALFLCVVFALLLYTLFLMTDRHEKAIIDSRSDLYAEIIEQQNLTAEKMDSLAVLIETMNTGKRHEPTLRNVIGSRRASVNSQLQQLPDHDMAMYQTVLSHMNRFIEAKDSVRNLSEELHEIRSDLIRCMEDQRNASARR